MDKNNSITHPTKLFPIGNVYTYNMFCMNTATVYATKTACDSVTFSIPSIAFLAPICRFLLDIMSAKIHDVLRVEVWKRVYIYG